MKRFLFLRSGAVSRLLFARVYPYIYVLSFGTVAAQARVSVEVQPVFQTTGCGNRAVPLLRIVLKSNGEGDASRRDEGVLRRNEDIFLREVSLRATAMTLRNVSRWAIYATHTADYHAATEPELLASVKASRGKRDCILRINGGFRVPEGDCFLWLTADVRPRATTGDSLMVELKQAVIGTSDGETTLIPTLKQTEFDGHGVRIFRRQSFAYVPTTDGCRFYRIPAMTLSAQGDIVVAADRRYESMADLGQHKIDVSVRRSRDGGKTWSPQQLIATGDGVSPDRYGYGDASLVRTSGGNLLCLMAASANGTFQGIRHIALCRSDDGGKTWTAPRDITRQGFTDAIHGVRDSLGIFSLFCASGRALCTSDGTVMVAAACLERPRERRFTNHILSSRDDGATWTLGKSCAYDGADESKLAEMNDGSLLLSVRQRDRRGFNRADAGAMEWQKQYVDSTLPCHECNADILCYSRNTQKGRPDILLHTTVMTHDRHGLQLWMSLDEGRTWHLATTLQHGGAAYSTMERLPNGDVAILFEDDSYQSGNGYYINFITLTRQQIMAYYRRLSGGK